MTKYNSLEILNMAINKGILIGNIIKKTPGAVINKLSKESRDILSKLKSDDIKNLRTDQIYGTDEWYENKQISEMKINFEKQFKK